ncbi:MAG: HNH endonuclease [Acidobacteria bacterium]|nr:HNH endonuclease [Acidobacteriota bacterium]MBI3423524.1 HNH endonuclease [Acidobacteriota bacterium]
MTRRRLPKKLRLLVKERARGCCEYCICQEAYGPDAFSDEHIVPLIAGGKSNAGNLARACQRCNNFKYNKTRALDPLTQTVAPLFHPRNHHWHEHFAWSDDYTLMLGLTAIGRATIAALDLNRAGVINQRKLLLLIRKHPPVKYRP